MLLFLSLSSCIAYVSCTKQSGDGRNPCLEPRRYFLYLQTVVPADTGSAGVPYKLPSAIVGYADTPIAFAYGQEGSDFKGPLSSIVDSTRWFIIPDTNNLTQGDTLTFYYDRKPLFLSTACGYTFVFSLKNVIATNNLIDSVRIDNSEVTNQGDKVHVKVFYR